MRKLQASLFARAVQVCGGDVALCASLVGVEEHAFRLWLEDGATAPADVYHALIDLILENDITEAEEPA